jgi:hypothetical protein
MNEPISKFKPVIWLWTTLKIISWLVIAFAALGLIIMVGGKVKTDASRTISDYMSQQCESRWERSGLNTMWEAGTGCLVNVDGRWVPEAHVQFQPKNSN